MSDNSLPLYNGSKTQCDSCNKKFNSGDVIFVDNHQGWTFCHSRSVGGCICIIEFSFSSGKTVAAAAKKYRKAEPFKSPKEEVQDLIKAIRSKSQ